MLTAVKPFIDPITMQKFVTLQGASPEMVAGTSRRACFPRFNAELVADAVDRIRTNARVETTGPTKRS